jgi:hypothetical protein
MMQLGQQATYHTGGIIMANEQLQPDTSEPSAEHKAELEAAMR